ncbi:hypothetical protein [Vreelandella massiliensis]|uniref:hypothetical protein n=1 Tax=Vreelandella massiliensis TaxID=1816686 RepID=UPI00096A2985|nr:hypothetical protein [Halomonas massiliensis]
MSDSGNKEVNAGNALRLKTASKLNRLPKDLRNDMLRSSQSGLDFHNNELASEELAKRADSALAVIPEGLETQDKSSAAYQSIHNGVVEINDDGSWSAVTYLGDDITEMSHQDQDAFLKERERRQGGSNTSIDEL